MFKLDNNRFHITRLRANYAQVNESTLDKYYCTLTTMNNINKLAKNEHILL